MSISFKIRFRDFLWFTHYCLIREVRDTTLFILILCVCALFGVSAFGPQSVKAFVHFEILKFVAIAAISCVIGVFLFTLVVYYLVGVFSPTGTSVSQKQLIALTDDNIFSSFATHSNENHMGRDTEADSNKALSDRPFSPVRRTHHSTPGISERQQMARVLCVLPTKVPSLPSLARSLLSGIICRRVLHRLINMTNQ
jgi:hypothetical protein